MHRHTCATQQAGGSRCWRQREQGQLDASAYCRSITVSIGERRAAPPRPPPLFGAQRGTRHRELGGAEPDAPRTPFCSCTGVLLNLFPDGELCGPAHSSFRDVTPPRELFKAGVDQYVINSCKQIDQTLETLPRAPPCRTQQRAGRVAACLRHGLPREVSGGAQGKATLKDDNYCLQEDDLSS